MSNKSKAYSQQDAASPTRTIHVSVEAVEAELKREEGKHGFRRILRSTLFALLAVAAIAVLVAVLVLPVLQINGSSMTDTLHDGDVVIAATTTEVKEGDLIAFHYNNNVLVKRVIATAGDWVDIDRYGNVSVNGKPLNEPYVTGKALGQTDITLPYQVPDGRVFVMGDHRDTSIDSRNSAIGCISPDMMVGKIIWRVWPIDRFGAV